MQKGTVWTSVRAHSHGEVAECETWNINGHASLHARAYHLFIVMLSAVDAQERV